MQVDVLPKKKLTRDERAELLRETILVAATSVVGEFGYQNASIGRIAIAAGIAQGTIYLYFETRQALFDEVLPHAGQDLIKFIGERLTGAKDLVDVEERGIRAFLAYLKQHPGFYRILNEAEFLAPDGHRKHFEQLLDHYVASLKRSVREGKMTTFTENELYAIAYSLMGARSYLYLGYVKYGGAREMPEHVIQTYLRLVSSVADSSSARK